MQSGERLEVSLGARDHHSARGRRRVPTPRVRGVHLDHKILLDARAARVVGLHRKLKVPVISRRPHALRRANQAETPGGHSRARLRRGAAVVVHVELREHARGGTAGPLAGQS